MENCSYDNFISFPGPHNDDLSDEDDGKTVRPRRDFQALRDRRLRAGEMFQRGSTQADIARELGVSRETASQWFAAWREGGTKALVGAQRAGRLPRLSDQQLAKVEKALSKGPRGNGFPTELWTLARIAAVIETVTGVSYSTTQTWWILRERLGWSRQRPARKALEGNAEAIATWARNRWPVVKNRPTPARVDRLRRQIGFLAPPLGESDLGAEREDPLRLNASVSVTLLS
jgi:transposase